MIEIVCERCGQKIKGTAYYTIDIYGKDINPTGDRRVSYETAVQNIQTNTFNMFGKEKQYCVDCKLEIEEFIKRK